MLIVRSAVSVYLNHLDSFERKVEINEPHHWQVL